MDPSTAVNPLSWITDLGVGAAIVGVVILFLRFLTEERKSRAVENDKFLKALDNIERRHDDTLKRIEDRHQQAIDTIANKLEILTEKVARYLHLGGYPHGPQGEST